MTVLKSLDDLIEEAKAEGKQPWELKLWALGFGSECYFTPYFKDKLDCWYGVREDNSAIKYIDTNTKSWGHYQEVKPKKKYALYAKCVGMQPTTVIFGAGRQINSEYRPPFFGSYALGLLEESEATDEYIKIPNTELELDE